MISFDAATEKGVMTYKEREREREREGERGEGRERERVNKVS